MTGWFAARTALVEDVSDCKDDDAPAPQIHPQKKLWSRSLIQEASTVTERVRLQRSDDRWASLMSWGISNRMSEGSNAAALE